MFFNEPNDFQNEPPNEHHSDNPYVLLMVIAAVVVILIVLAIYFGFRHLNADNRGSFSPGNSQEPSQSIKETEKFKENLNSLHDAAVKMFSGNIPEEIGDKLTMTLAQLQEYGHIGELSLGEKACDTAESNSSITKTKDNEYRIYTYLVCGNKKDELIENFRISSSGNSTIFESITIPESISYIETEDLGNNVTEIITKTITDELKMKTITTLLNNRTLNTDSTEYNAKNIPYLEIKYPTKTVIVKFVSPATDDVDIDGTIYRLNYSGNAYEDMLRVFTGTSVKVDNNLDFVYLEDLKKITLTTYEATEAGTIPITQSISDELQMKKVLAALYYAEEYDVEISAPANAASIRLIYDYKEILVGFVADDIISIDGKSYKVNYNGDSYEKRIREIFKNQEN